MSVDNNAYDLSYVVMNVLAKINEPEKNLYVRLLQFANNGFRRLNLAGTMPLTAKATEIIIDPHTHTGVLPDDYVSFLKMGVCRGGVLINFTTNDSLCPLLPEASVCSCAEDIATDIDNHCNNAATGESMVQGWGGSWYYPYYSRWHNGQFVAGVYGQGAGYSAGGYRIDLAANKIQFDSCINVDSCILEYKSSGLTSGGNAIIEQTAIPALTAWVQMEYNEAIKDARWAQHYRRIWVQESAGMVKRQNALTYNQWLTLYRNLTFQTPKR